VAARTKKGHKQDQDDRTLDDVVEHYDRHFDLKLTDREKKDLVEYLNSI
jgi:hypothetical protein